MEETLAIYEDQPRQLSVCLGHFPTGFGPHTPLYLVKLPEGCEPKKHSLGYLSLHIWMYFTMTIPT